MCQFILADSNKKCGSWTFRDHLLVGVILGTEGLCKKLNYLTPYGHVLKVLLRWKTVIGSKCIHEQSQDRTINLPKRDETTYRPDLRLTGTGTSWTRLREPYF